MNKTEFANGLSRMFHRTSLKVRKHSPEILAVAGIGGIVVSTVMACKATLKVDEIIEESNTRIAKIHEVLADETISEEKYTEEDARKDIAIVRVQTGVKFVKLYGPAVALGAVSIASMLASNNILRKRNVALVAAYTAVDSSFKEYRNRLIERFGKELDKELRFDVKAKEIEEVTVDEKGNEVVTTKVVEVADPCKLHSEYARCYDAGNVGWDPNPAYSLLFLRSQQDFANDKLRLQGYLFLNDVYEMLGFPKTKAGQIVGWVYDIKRPNGDNYVDFGIYDINKEANRNFINGYEKAIWLDFNVDGPILDLI